MNPRDMTKEELLTALEVARGEISILRSRHEPRHDTYACQRCGRRDGMDAVVDDKLWDTIMDNPKEKEGLGILCLWCMDALALEKKVSGRVRLYFPGRALLSDDYLDC